MQIGPYEFEQPSWWDEVDVVLPENINTEEEAREFIGANFGSDVGTEKTWRNALKAWAIFDQRANGFPVYIAHCFMEGGEVELAAKVYQDLYFLSSTKANADWYKCYLAYETAQAFDKLDDRGNAAKWYSLSAQVKYINPKDSAAISYYTNESRIRLSKLRVTRSPN